MYVLYNTVNMFHCLFFDMYSEPSFITRDTSQKQPAIDEIREVVSFIFYCYVTMQYTVLQNETKNKTSFQAKNVFKK